MKVHKTKPHKTKPHKTNRIVTTLLVSAALAVYALPVLAGEAVGNWNKYEPNNQLEIPAEELKGTVIAGKMTANQPVVIWTANELNEEEKDVVWNSLKGNPGVGNPKEVVYISGNTAAYGGMTVDEAKGTVVFDRKNNWSLIYTGEYRNGEDSTADSNSGQAETTGEENEPEQETVPGEEKGPEQETAPGEEKGPEQETVSGEEENPEQETAPGEGENPEKETVSGEEENPEKETVSGEVEKPENEAGLEEETVFGEVNDPAPVLKADTLPELTVDVPMPEKDMVPYKVSAPVGKKEAAGNSGSRSGEMHDSSGSGGPGTARVPDQQPETGLQNSASDRQLDATPKTGMPVEFIILLSISAAATVMLAVTLFVEKKLA